MGQWRIRDEGVIRVAENPKVSLLEMREEDKEDDGTEEMLLEKFIGRKKRMSPRCRRRRSVLLI